MTTVQNSIIAGAMARIAHLPPPAALTEHDFKVCEDCGAPALIHPRLEVGASGANWNGPRKILCCVCLHNMVQKRKTKRDARFRIGDQIWQCCACAMDRAWGLLEPADRALVPALHCERCSTTTRHIYSRVS